MNSIFLGCTINGEHTYKDWHCAITNSDIISMPEPNLTLLDVPGKSGRLDLSEALTGDVSYTNRTIKLELATLTNIEDWIDTGLYIFNAFHGRRVKVIFDDDPTRYYEGRAVVSNPERLRTAGTLTITIDADPFRLNVEETAYALTGSNNTITRTLRGDRMPTIPTITVDKDCELIFDDVTYQLLVGDNVVAGFILTEGDNTFTIKGTNTATIKYREGCL